MDLKSLLLARLNISSFFLMITNRAMFNYSQNPILFLTHLKLFPQIIQFFVIPVALLGFFFNMIRKRKRFYTSIHLLAMQVWMLFKGVRRVFLCSPSFLLAGYSCPTFTLFWIPLQTLRTCWTGIYLDTVDHHPNKTSPSLLSIWNIRNPSNPPWFVPIPLFEWI